MTTAITINQPALEAAYKAALAANPDTSKGWGKAIQFAYEWLMDVWADEGQLVFDADGALLVNSATEPGRVYHANGLCDCEAFERSMSFHGKSGICWHRAAARLVKRMQERQQAGRQQAAISIGTRRARAAEALALVNELFA